MMTVALTSVQIELLRSLLEDKIKNTQYDILMGIVNPYEVGPEYDLARDLLDLMRMYDDV